MARKPLNLTGSRFGRLVALSWEGVSVKNGNSQWRCRCDCGREVVADSQNLKSGITKSCGCSRIKHGWSAHPLYFAWATMIQRCTNPKAESFHYYGGRGITVDPAWLDFTTFLKDMGPRPEGLSLDRKDPNGPYSKDNCRWATWKEQAANKRQWI